MGVVNGSVHFVVPIRTKPMNNTREHWASRAKRVKMERGATRAAWLGVGSTSPTLPCAVTLIRVAPRKLDGDNLQSALKAVRDEMAEIIGVDDGDESMVTWLYEQRQPERPRAYWAEVKIVEYPFA